MDIYQLLTFAEILKDSIDQAIPQKCQVDGSFLTFILKLRLLLPLHSNLLHLRHARQPILLPHRNLHHLRFHHQTPRHRRKCPLLANHLFRLLSYFIITFLSMMAAIAISADSNNDNKLSSKELWLRIVRCWTRPFLTAFYTTIFSTEYAYSVFYMATPLPVFKDLSNLKVAVLFSVAAYVIYLYLSSVWILSLVVDEEDGGGDGIGALANQIC